MPRAAARRESETTTQVPLIHLQVGKPICNTNPQKTKREKPERTQKMHF